MVSSGGGGSVALLGTSEDSNSCLHMPASQSVSLMGCPAFLLCFTWNGQAGYRARAHELTASPRTLAGKSGAAGVSTTASL